MHDPEPAHAVVPAGEVDLAARGGTAPHPVVPATLVLQEPPARSARWVMIRNVIVFQGKLIVDGLKDLVLGPLTIVAAVADLFAPPGREGRHLYRSLRWGKRFEDWINLFEPVEREDGSGTQLAEPSKQGVDAYVQGFERLLSEQVAKGGITAAAKQTIDGALDNLRNNAMLGAKWQPPSPVTVEPERTPPPAPGARPPEPPA